MVEYPVHTRPVTCSSQVAATRPVGQAVKTPPFHGGNMGSIPVRVTMRRIPMLLHRDFFRSLPTAEKKRKPLPISVYRLGVIANQPAGWCGNLVDFAESSRKAGHKSSEIATPVCALARNDSHININLALIVQHFGHPSGTHPFPMALCVPVHVAFPSCLLWLNMLE